MGFRHEFKHCINTADYLTIRSRIRHVAVCDRGGEYKIRSIYFDNYNDKSLMEKVSGLNNRSKFRIRFYNDDSSFIKLEKKSKVNGLCLKRSEVISRDAAELLLTGNFEKIKKDASELLWDLYLKMKNELLRPKTIVDYVREAYIFKAGNVRVTFDKSIKSGLFSTDVFNPDLTTVETLNHRYMVLEVKYDEFLPSIINDLIQTGNRMASSISKYALCRMYG